MPAGDLHAVVVAIEDADAAIAHDDEVPASEIAAGWLVAARPRQDYLLASDAAEFAAAILGLLGSPELRGEVGRAGRRFVEANHSWDSAVAHLERIYAGCAAQLIPQPVTL